MINSIHFWQHATVLLQGDLASSSFKGFWVCKLAQVWLKQAGPAFMIQVRVLFS